MALILLKARAGIATGIFLALTYAVALHASSLPIGTLFVGDVGGDEGTGSMYAFSPEGNMTTLLPPSPHFVPTGLAFDSSGNLFGSNFHTGDIFAITPEGRQTTFSSGLTFPLALA